MVNYRLNFHHDKVVGEYIFCREINWNYYMCNYLYINNFVTKQIFLSLLYAGILLILNVYYLQNNIIKDLRTTYQNNYFSTPSFIIAKIVVRSWYVHQYINDTHYRCTLHTVCVTRHVIATNDYYYYIYGTSDHTGKLHGRPAGLFDDRR